VFPDRENKKQKTDQMPFRDFINANFPERKDLSLQVKTINQ
jgi:hypothetical protein